MKRLVVLLALACTCVLFVAASGALYLTLLWRSPVFSPPLVVAIERGQPFAALARSLEEAGAIPNARLFTLLARARGDDRRVRSGEYEVAGGTTAVELLDALVSGKQRLRLVTVPEGLTVEETALLLERAGFGSAERFRGLAADLRFLASLDIPGPGLEGYLYPDTYAFEKTTTAEEIVRTMTARFREMLTPDLVEAAADRGLSVAQAVTLASLIEEEAAVADERPRISAVFHNRLARGMPLQSDPTVLYGVGGGDGRIRSADLARATPYNTYVIPGLPPGPIANPGRASLDAAVRPAAGVTALYFVSRNDGTHEFNDTLAAHQRAVNHYQRVKKPR